MGVNRKLVKNTMQIEGVRESGRVNTTILDYIATKIAIGLSTEDINRLVHNKTIQLGGIPAPLGYEGFPKSVCVSINNEVCHGIPSENRILKDGDIVNVDVSTIYKGYYSDSSRMFCIGNVSAKRKRLVEVAKESMVNMGVDKVYMDEENGWTIYTEDGLDSAQWEVTVLVTKDGYQILAY